MLEKLTELDYGWHESQESGLSYEALAKLFYISKDVTVPLSGGRRWLVGDHALLHGTAFLETLVKKSGLPDEAPASVKSELDTYLESFFTALPFSEAERGIVRGAYQANWKSSGSKKPYKEVPAAIREIETEVISGGVQVAVSGRDMMRRWWAWRRGTDEFEGQDGLSQARVALTGLVGRLIPPERMPDFYYELQGRQRPVPRPS